jgi:hypothetical protein
MLEFSGMPGKARSGRIQVHRKEKRKEKNGKLQRQKDKKAAYA